MTHATRTCPYCWQKIKLGNCEIVATHYTEPAPDAAPDWGPGAERPTPPTVRPYSGARFLGLAGGYPVIVAPQLKPERNAPKEEPEPGIGPLLASYGRRLVPRFVWQHLPRPLQPLNARASSQDIPARSCYKCGHPLPPALDNRRLITVAVAGTTSAGKTHYLASMLLLAAREQGLEQVGCKEFALDEDSERRFQEDYFSHVFQLRGQMEPTNPAGHQERPRALTCNITFEGGDPVALLFHDVAGETLTDQRQRATDADFVGQADALIFLVDPVQLDRADWRKRERSHDEAAQTQSQVGLLNACVEDLARHHGSKPWHRRTASPVALTLSKSDLLAELLPGSVFGFSQQAPAHKSEDPVGNAERWRADIEATQKYVIKVLQDLHAPDLLAAANAFPKDRLSFHAVAAIGSTPVDGRIEVLDPLRCLDPLFTLLHRIPGVVPGTGW
ncbi:hypothetical protein [Streptomyces sp. NPDC005538]|uniref:TRAFAC clade GTPase domain-containing protein n=1 Tax=unclassified Streptomyces TaxID=2593676 RepID=UPI0033A1DACC